MDYLAILEKICGDLLASTRSGTPMYVFTSAIYDTWSNGTELEKNLAKKLVELWQNNLKLSMKWDYERTQNNPYRLEYTKYCDNWINIKLEATASHLGIKAALIAIRES